MQNGMVNVDVANFENNIFFWEYVPNSIEVTVLYKPNGISWDLLVNPITVLSERKLNPMTGTEKIVLTCLYHILRQERKEQGEIVVKEGKNCL